MIKTLVFLFLIPSLSLSQTLNFPENFQWCVATASHQIEGNNKDSDWWEFERRPGTIKHNDKSIKATDHWNRLEEDTQILVDLGVKSYRFSLEWAKIEPKEGQWNKDALEHYKKEILLLKKNNINPMVTLHHFSLPLWFAKKGGWANKQAPQYFQKYITKVYNHLGDLGVSSWATFNEPTWNLISGYVTGEFPPGKKDIKLLKDPLKGVILSHGLAYKTLHQLAKNKPIKVGLVQNLNVFIPLRWWNPLDHYAKSILDNVYNWSILNTIKNGHFKVNFPTAFKDDSPMPQLKNTLDFLGVNYYTRQFIKFMFSPPFIKAQTMAPKEKITEMGWEIYPKGIYTMAKKAHQTFPRLPIFITENGIGDKTDKKRPQFIKEHLFYIHKLLQERIPILGYCYWTLIDNFEWAHGYKPRFGLYNLDLKTLKRTPRNSAKIYSEIIKNNGFFYDKTKTLFE